MNYITEEERKRNREFMREFWAKRPDLLKQFHEEILVSPTEPEVQRIKDDLEKP